MPKRPKAIIFDFDGTLVDASEAICRSFNEVLGRFDLPEMDQQWIRHRVGTPLVSMFAELLNGRDPALVDDLVREYQQVFLPYSLSLTRLLPGTAGVLAHYSANTKLGIATSRKSRGAIRILERFDLLKHFSAVVGIEHVAASKPDPAALCLVLEQLKASPQEAVMVGDTTHDVIAGKRAGVTAIGVTTGPHSKTELIKAGADRVVSRLTQLKQILESL